MSSTSEYKEQSIRKEIETFLSKITIKTPIINGSNYLIMPHNSRIFRLLRETIMKDVIIK